MKDLFVSIVETVLAGLVKDLISKWLEQWKKRRKTFMRKRRNSRKAKKSK